MRAAEVNFEYPSVGATENVMMAAVLADGVTIIENGAREPEISALAGFLNSMGARVMGAGTGRIVIEGVDELHPTEWTVMPDRIEAGTFLMATAATGGDVTVTNALPEHLKMELEKLREMGVEVSATQGSPGIRVRVDDPASLSGVDVATLPFPGFATDLQAQMMVLLTQATGAGIITENVYENRLQVAEELNRLDAGIDLFGGHRALIRGPRRPRGLSCRRPTCAAARRSSWPAWSPKAPPSWTAPSTSCGATRTSKTSSPPSARPSPSRRRPRSLARSAFGLRLSIQPGLHKLKCCERQPWLERAD